MKHKPLIPQVVYFYKMQGSGNDFVLLLNDQIQVPDHEMSQWARKICTRSFGVGADGLIFLASVKEPSIDYRWHFYNADGSRAEMCGNGSRCAAWLAYELGIADVQQTFGTDAGPVKAEVFPAQNSVKVQLTTPRNIKTNIKIRLEDGSSLELHFVDTGVPHAVLTTEDASCINLSRIGPEIRFHPFFSPQGTNVDVVQVLGDGSLYVRTYERGVEAETYACGTGAAAAFVIANHLGLCQSRGVVKTSGGEELIISLEQGAAFLTGQALLVYEGHLNLKAIGIENYKETLRNN